MKSYGSLFEQVVSSENISKAIEKAAEEKKDREEVERVLKKKDYYIKKIQYALIHKTFYIKKQKAIIIDDGPKHKKRLILQPQFSYELTVQHCLMNIVAPLIMSRMYTYNCGSVPERGNFYGKKYIERKIHEYPQGTRLYCLKLDIKKFFPSINHSVLKDQLRRLLRDEDVLYYLFYIIDSYSVIYHEDEDYYETFYFDDSVQTGVPVGYITSQWFANFYLEGLDRLIKQDCKAPVYIRFMDDMTLISDSKEFLWSCFNKIKVFVEQDLLLFLKSNYQLFPIAFNQDDKNGRSIDFMGFRFYIDYTLVSRHIMLAGSRKAAKINKKVNNPNKDFTWYDSTQFLSYDGWYGKTDCYKLEQRILTTHNINKKDLKKKISNHSKKITMEKKIASIKL